MTEPEEQQIDEPKLPEEQVEPVGEPKVCWHANAALIASILAVIALVVMDLLLRWISSRFENFDPWPPAYWDNLRLIVISFFIAFSIFASAYSFFIEKKAFLAISNSRGGLYGFKRAKFGKWLGILIVFFLFTYTFCSPYSSLHRRMILSNTQFSQRGSDAVDNIRWILAVNHAYKEKNGGYCNQTADLKDFPITCGFIIKSTYVIDGAFCESVNKGVSLEGYYYRYTVLKKEKSENGKDIVTSFVVCAWPETLGKTGPYVFIANEKGVIYYRYEIPDVDGLPVIQWPDAETLKKEWNPIKTQRYTNRR